MSIWISKPVAGLNGNLIGPVATYQSSDMDIGVTDTSADVNADIVADTGKLASIGLTTDQISHLDWDGGNGTNTYGLATFKLSAIDSNTSPTISDLNNSTLITEYWHSSHSNSANGTNYLTNVDDSSFHITYGGVQYDFTNRSTAWTATTAGQAAFRTTDSDNSWYLNGILVGSQTSGSGNEEYPTDYWSKTDFQTNRNDFKDQVISKIATNQNDIIEFLVKNSLTPEATKRLYVQLSNDGIIT